MIAAISPSWAASRSRARADLARSELVFDKMRGFHATSRGRRMGDWLQLGTDKPTEPIAELTELRRRAREMRRNNPYFAAAINTIVGVTVGHGIRGSVTHSDKRSRAAVQRSWDSWARSKLCDAAGKCDLYAIQSLVMQTVALCGECLVRRVFDGTGSSRRLRLQVLPPEYLASKMDREPAGIGENPIVGGVETNGYGEAVAYHLYRRHPSTGSQDVARVPASEVIHAFRVEYPGQVRGIAWVAPVFTRLAALDDFQDAELTRQKIAACFGLFYVGQEPEGDYEIPEKIEPGMAEYLPPGTDVKTITPPSNQSLDVMARITLQAIASGLGISYESLTHDYSKVTFSSARMSHLAMGRNVKTWQQDIMIELFLDRVWAWFSEFQDLQGVRGANKAGVEWSLPAPVLVDPDKETKAIVARIRSGLVSWSDAVREQGKDPAQVLQSIKDDNSLWDDNLISLDCDPRRVSLQGQGAVNQKQEDEGGDAEQAA